MKETKHDYQKCLMGNFYDSKCTAEYSSWEEFKTTHLGFCGKNFNDFDDRYHFVFRYDIHKQDDENYELELCMMLQRKGIYTHLYIENITQEELDTEVEAWLKGRCEYLKNLWSEVM